MKSKMFINLVPSLESCDKLTVKVIDSNFNQWLNDSLEPYNYPISQSKTGLEIFEDLVSFIYYDSSCYLYQKPTDEIRRLLNVYNVNPERIIQCISENLKKINKDIRIAFADKPIKSKVNTSVKLTGISNRQKIKFTKFLNDYNRPIRQVSFFEANDAYNAGNENVWAVRSKYGEHECLFYIIDDNKQEIDNRIIRYTYSLDTYCNYLEVREISFEGWLNCDEEHKYATQP